MIAFMIIFTCLLFCVIVVKVERANYYRNATFTDTTYIGPDEKIYVFNGPGSYPVTREVYHDLQDSSWKHEDRFANSTIQRDSVEHVSILDKEKDILWVIDAYSADCYHCVENFSKAVEQLSNKQGYLRKAFT